MAILFAQEWDILTDDENRYEDFIAAQYIPQCNRIGLRAVGGFYVEAGFGPRIIFLGSTETLQELNAILSSKPFRGLTSELKKSVINYRSKILEPTGRVKHEKYEIQKGVWKYNQYYDLIPGRKQEYADFILREHLPAMQKLDYVEVTGGWNVIIGGFSEIIAEFTFRDPVDIGRLLGNENYRKITQKLRRDYAANYMSRILRTTERFDEPRWYRL